MENSSTESAQGESSQAGSTPEMVEIHEATDQDLDAFLEASQQEGFESIEQPLPEEPAQKQEENVVQQAEMPQQTPEAPVSKQELDAVRKQLEGLELLNKRRTSELAELKQQQKQLRSFIEAKSQGLDEKFLESPTQAYAQMRQVEMAQQKLMQAEAEEQALTNATQAHALLAHHVGQEGVDFEGIAEVFRDDGMPQEFIQAFMANPYQAALPETLIQLAKRANMARKVRSMEEALQKLVPFAEQLIAERRQLPDNVLKNVSSALRQGPQVTGSAGGTGQIGSSRSVDFSKMSDKELEEFLKG